MESGPEILSSYRRTTFGLWHFWPRVYTVNIVLFGVGPEPSRAIECKLSHPRVVQLIYIAPSNLVVPGQLPRSHNNNMDVHQFVVVCTREVEDGQSGPRRECVRRKRLGW